MQPFNLDLKVDKEIRTALSAGNSVVVLGCKYSGKSWAADKLARLQRLTIIDIPGPSPKEDYERLLRARREASRGQQIAVFISHAHNEYFQSLNEHRDGRKRGILDSNVFPHKEIPLSVGREEAFGKTKVGTQADRSPSFLREYLREYGGESRGDFIYLNLGLDPDLKETILNGTRYKQRGYETFVPPLIRVCAELLCKNNRIERAIAGKNQHMLKEGFGEVRRTLENKKEHTVFLQTLFGLDSSWFAAVGGLAFEGAMHALKETLKAVLPFGSEIVALAGLGIAQGLWRRARGEKASVLGGLVEAGNHWKTLSEEERRFFGYRLERARKLEPDTAFMSLEGLFYPASEIRKHLEEHINTRADAIWKTLQNTPQAKALLDRMEWFDERLAAAERRLGAVEQRQTALEQDVAQIKLKGCVELTTSNASEKLGVKEEEVVGLGSGEADELIIETAKEIIRKAGSAPVIIIGEPGAGKTTLLYLIGKRLLDDNKEVRLIEDMGAFAFRESSESDSKEYWLFDATKAGAREFLEKLEPYLIGRINLARVIAAVRTDYLPETEYSSKERLQSITHSLAYRESILEGIVDRWAGTYSPPEASWPKFRQAILQRCEGSPFYISQAMAFLESKGYAEDALERLPHGVRELVVGILENLSQHDSRQLVAYYVISRYNHLPKMLVDDMKDSLLAFDTKKRFFSEVGDEVRAHSWYRDVFQEIVAKVREGDDDTLASRLKAGVYSSRQLYLGLSRAAGENETLEKDWLEADVEDRLNAIAWGLLIQTFRAQLNIDPYLAGSSVGHGLKGKLHAALLGFALHELFADISYPERTRGSGKLMWISALYLPRLVFSPVSDELGKGVLDKGGPAPSLEWLVSLQDKTSSPMDERCIALVTWALASMGHIGTKREDHGETATLFRLLQMYDRELAEYDRAIDLNPNELSYRIRKGTALVELGRLEMALGEFEKAIQLNPSHPDSRNHKGMALLKLGRDKEALGEFEKAIQLNPSNYRYHGNRGFALFRSGRLEMALGEFEKAIQLNPSHPDLYSNEAAVLSSLGRDEEALREYDRAIQLNPSDPHYHYKRGDALFKSGRLEMALAESEKAILLNPLDPDYHTSRGDALSGLGRDEEALVEFEQAKRLRLNQ
ncbi:MAG: tetratricopeptide repeat protein [Methanobacteriota archaeon]|nr:MAG: tetratricopeptide repeat protein [Euryarchaeota archaeon]